MLRHHNIAQMPLTSRPRFVLLLTVGLVGLTTATFPLLFGVSSPMGELFSLAARGLTAQMMRTNDLTHLDGVIAACAAGFNMFAYGSSAILWYFVVRKNPANVRNFVTLTWFVVYLVLFYVFFPAEDVQSILFPS